MKEILFTLWFFLPVGIANVTPIFVSHISFLKIYSYPLDFFKTFRGKRIFGDHKTIRGLVSGVVAGVLTVIVQQYVYVHSSSVQSIVPIDYVFINPFIFGFLAGLGAILGDSIKSFFKRQFGIKEGKSWFPFDQIDYIFGGILFTYFYVPLSAEQYFFILAVWFLIHVFSTIVGYLLKLKTSPL